MRRICWVIGLMLLGAPVLAAKDYPGSSDHAGLDRFPLSYIVHYRDQNIPEYRLALGELEKINGVVTPEKEVRLSGPLKRVIYRLPNSYSAQAPFDHFRDQLTGQGFEILFECAGQACGSSNYWANTIFRYSKLYGLERSQRYLALKKAGQHIALYSIKRGNKRVYTIVDVVGKAEEQKVSKLDQLLEAGSLLYRQPLADEVLEYLRQTESPFWLLGAVAPAEDADAGVSRSVGLAEAVRDQLVEAGIAGEKVRVHGVGALMPSKELREAQVWIVIP